MMQSLIIYKQILEARDFTFLDILKEFTKVTKILNPIILFTNEANALHLSILCSLET